MTGSGKLVLAETAKVAIGQGICVGLMFAAYALLGSFSLAVLLGGFAGAMLALGHFCILARLAALAADKAEAGDAEGGKKLMKGSYPLRLLALGTILVFCARSGAFDVLALGLPLVFMRPILTLTDFFRKKGA